jgi:hypothetical protein
MNRGVGASVTIQNTSQRGAFDVSSKSGIVLDIVYNDAHPKIEEIEANSIPETVDKRRVDFLYYAKVRKDSDVSSKLSDGQWIPPHSYTDLDLPVKGERVHLIDVQGRQCYKRIGSFDLNLGNFDPNGLIASNPVVDIRERNKKNKYKEVSKSGTPTSKSQGSDESQLQNNFIKPQQINPLKVFEGDKVIQSRFGQSIRFSAHYNNTQEFSPTIVIRNRQGNKQTSELLEKTPTLEDFKDDGSIIALTSNNQKLPYTKDFLDAQVTAFGGGYTDGGEFEESTYPAEFTGDNILIKSSRIALASQEGEMIFLSKGNYGFISDGLFTIDNFNPNAQEDEKGGGGALLNFGGDVVIKTNGDDIKLLGDDAGLVYINTLNQDEPIVKGNTLLDLLTELINLINAQQYQTPSGPSALGPDNREDFNKLRDRLNAFLSEKNFTE